MEIKNRMRRKVVIKNIFGPYSFLFVGGSCGSFAKSIFNYYEYRNRYKDSNYQILPRLSNIDPVTGHCHNLAGPIPHSHRVSDLDLTRKIVVIDFDDEDRPAIARMAFYKAMWPEICRNPQKIKEYCGGEISHIDPTDFELLEKTVLSNPDYLIFPDWREQLKQISPVLTLTFKDIMYGCFHQKIANFFQIDPLPKIDKHIESYRNINKKYLDN